MLLLFANKSTFDITVNGDTVTLTGNSGAGLAGAYYLDTITMTNVESIMFADQTIEVADLSSSSSGTETDLCPICGISHNNDQSEHPPVNDIPTDNNTPHHTLPITPDGDNAPYPIPLYDISLWAEEYDLGLIDLPLVAIDSAPLLVDIEASLEDLVMIEDPMVLDFECLSGDDLYVDINPVKPLHVPLLNIDSRESWENVIDGLVWLDNA